MLSIRKRDYLLDCYSNISEMYNDLKNKPRRRGAHTSSADGSFSFTGTNSLEEAYDLMIRGDDKLYKKIKDESKKIDISKILGNVIKRNRIYNDIVGFQANVPNYLLGIPTDMISTIPNRKSQKILNIIINVTVSCDISTEQYSKAGSYYYILIDLLEKAGYRCNVHLLIADRSKDEIYLLLKAKTDREPFNREKMAFLLTHPSFFRRIGFKWIESCNCYGEPTHDGYGIPITNDSEKIKRIMDKELKANFIIWSIQKDFKVKLEDIIENLEKQGIKLKEEN